MRMTLALLGLTAALSSCATHGATKPLSAVLPAPMFAEGWRMEGVVRSFGKDTLFDHINGEAEAYYPYGFRALVTAEYVFGDDLQSRITADVYEMGSLLDAFGIYSNYRSPAMDFVKIGGQGYCGPSQVLFYQDRFFVRLTGFGTAGQSSEHLMRCARAISDRLPKSSASPPELAMLGIEGITPHSESYIAQSVLGYAFFSRGLVAEATIAEKPVRVFVVLEDSPESAALVFRQYADYLAAKGSDLQQIGAGPAIRLMAKDPLHKGVAAQVCDRYIVGVVGLIDPVAGTSLLEQLSARCER